VVHHGAVLARDGRVDVVGSTTRNQVVCEGGPERGPSLGEPARDVAVAVFGEGVAAHLVFDTPDPFGVGGEGFR